MKRAIDIAVGATVALIVSPVIGVAAFATWCEDRASPWFYQVRAGQCHRLFKLIKIRSMIIHDDDPLAVGQVGGEHHLLTFVGRWIRRFKIDELPQIWNVLIGDMSLVGPRPALAEQAQEYSDFQRRRLEMRPGMTGWAQVNGNVQLSWNDRILLDVWYIDHWSLWLDFVIVLKTFYVIIGGEVANPAAVEKAREYAQRIGGSS